MDHGWMDLLSGIKPICSATETSKQMKTYFTKVMTRHQCMSNKGNKQLVEQK